MPYNLGVDTIFRYLYAIMSSCPSCPLLIQRRTNLNFKAILNGIFLLISQISMHLKKGGVHIEIHQLYFFYIYSEHTKQSNKLKHHEFFFLQIFFFNRRQGAGHRCRLGSGRRRLVPFITGQEGGETTLHTTLTSFTNPKLKEKN